MPTVHLGYFDAVTAVPFQLPYYNAAGPIPKQLRDRAADGTFTSDPSTRCFFFVRSETRILLVTLSSQASAVGTTADAKDLTKLNLKLDRDPKAFADTLSQLCEGTVGSQQYVCFSATWSTSQINLYARTQLFLAGKQSPAGTPNTAQWLKGTLIGVDFLTTGQGEAATAYFMPVLELDWRETLQRELEGRTPPTLEDLQVMYALDCFMKSTENTTKPAESAPVSPREAMVSAMKNLSFERGLNRKLVFEHFTPFVREHIEGRYSSPSEGISAATLERISAFADDMPRNIAKYCPLSPNQSITPISQTDDAAYDQGQSVAFTVQATAVADPADWRARGTATGVLLVPGSWSALMEPLPVLPGIAALSVYLSADKSAAVLKAADDATTSVPSGYTQPFDIIVDTQQTSAQQVYALVARLSGTQLQQITYKGQLLKPDGPGGLG